MQSTEEIKKRLEELRSTLEAENISYGELHELQSLAAYIEPDDMQLREAAGLPEDMPRELLSEKGPPDTYQKPQAPIDKVIPVTATYVMLRELVANYYNRTERYDRMVCTGKIINGAITPRTGEERRKITLYAKIARAELEEAAAMKGFNKQDVHDAMNEHSRLQKA